MASSSKAPQAKKIPDFRNPPNPPPYFVLPNDLHPEINAAACEFLQSQVTNCMRRAFFEKYDKMIKERSEDGMDWLYDTEYERGDYLGEEFDQVMLEKPELAYHVITALARFSVPFRRVIRVSNSKPSPPHVRLTCSDFSDDDCFMMRLRVTVCRHGLPETPIIWSIDTNTAPTVYQLLEQINAIVPIETEGQWGLEDYAVELKGIGGVNYECLHFQPVASVMKEEDEVIIRPLLTQDLRVRRISGRHQISDDGKRLYDGLALGRPLLRTPANRPAINIPPRKKPRITYNEDEDDDEGFAALKYTEESDNENSQQLLLDAKLDDEDSEDDDDFAPGEEDSDAAEDSDGDEEADNQQKALYADLDDEDSEDDEDDEDFAPEESQDANEDDDGNKQLVLHAEFDNADSESEEEDEDLSPRENSADEEIGTSDQKGEDSESRNDNFAAEPASSSVVQDVETKNINEPALAGISDPETRAKIRKLHSAFPQSHLAVCKYILNGKGVEGDIGEAYEVLARGFCPTKPKSEITETVEGHTELPVQKTRPKRKSKSPTVEMDDLDSMPVEADENINPVVEHYDQHGLPPGSIIASGVSTKSIRFDENDEELSNGLTSTPFIDKQSQEVESSDDDSDSEDSSDEDVSSSSDSSESSSDDTDEQMVDAVHDSSSSDSSDSSSDSSSDDEAPEEKSTKTTPQAVSHPPSPPSAATETPRKAKPIVINAKGKSSTRARNARRRNANLLERYKQKGILPAGTTLAELSQLQQVNSETSPEDAQAALDALRAQKGSTKANSSLEKASLKMHGTPTHNDAKEEFELRRQELLTSLANGGIEVGPESAKKSRKSPTPTQTPIPIHETLLIPTSEIVAVEQAVTSDADNRSSLFSKVFSSISPNIVDTKAMDIEGPTPSTALEGPKALDTPLQSPKSQPASVKSSQNAPRRAKLDLGAGRRMLFGALGLKNPKTKKDEEKLKQDLMKDVKPLITLKPVDEPETNIDEVVEEDSEAWREKIIYRAVECVQEDVELSEPPFPFVQRWDPQQRWSQKGKRKKDQRDQGQNYNEDSRASKKQKHRKGKHAYADQQEYLDASYEPSYQEDSTMDSQFDDSVQVQAQHSDVDEETNRQLMNNDQVPVQDSQSHTDIATLPEDLFSLPDLHNGEAKVGMTIALKKLEMSAETQWQPQISGYVTAKITAVADHGVLTLMLALRDQKQTKHYDEKTGERLYEKFEVPDDDDEMEVDDDGTLYLSFGDLIEPKIVQQSPAILDKDVLVSDRSQENIEHAMDMNEDTQINPTEEPRLKEGHSTDESTTLEHEDDLPKAKPSLGEKLTGPQLNDEDLAETQPSYDIRLPEHQSFNDDLPEAQFSHVTDTPLNYEAPAIYQQEPQPEHQLGQGIESAESHAEFSVVQEMEVEESPVKVHATEEMETQNLPIEDPVTQEMDAENFIFDPVTPAPDEDDELPPNIDLSAESVTEEARQSIALMMRNAGFRSSVPSSILRDIRPDGMQSPGEVASFEKLRQDMNGVNGNKESQAYSPKFNGLGSSPIRKPRESSRTPVKPRQPAPASSSPTKPPTSSWETVDQDYGSSPPPQRERSLPPYETEEQSSWVTIGQTQTQAQPSSPPAFTSPRHSSPSAAEPGRPTSPSKPEEVARSHTPQAPEPVKTSSLAVPEAETRVPENPRPVAKVPVGKAQAYWQLFQDRKRTRDSDSESESARISSKPSPKRPLGLDGTEDNDNDVDASVKYAKLPMGSSFTSQVTDHGRQPDFDFGDSVMLSADSPVLPDLEMDKPSNRMSQHGREPEQNHSKGKDKADVNKQVDTKADLARPKKSLFTKTIPAVPSDDSDDDLPPLHQLSQLSQRSATIKHEKPVPMKTKNSTKVGMEYNKAMAAVDEESSEDQTTFKASQMQRQASAAQSSKSRASESRHSARAASQPSKSRISEAQASQSRSSLPRGSQLPRASQSREFSIPKGSQVMDLTLSSDAEPEPELSIEVDEHPKPFRTYHNYSDDDEDYNEDGSGWAAKNSSTIKGVEPQRRQTSMRLRQSSQGALNARNRRQTSYD